MTKTLDLTGAEAKVSDLGGQNAAVKNLSAGTVWASIYPDITAGADNVVEIPAGGGEVVLDARGTVYLLGTGKVQCTGTDYATPNFKQPSQSASGGGGGTSDVTKAYVDAQDNTNLGAAKAYTDTAINAVNNSVTANAENISALQSDLATAQADIAENTAAAEAAQTAADTNAANITSSAAETLAAANSYTDTKASALDTRITANANAISVLNGTGDGSVKKAVSDGIAAVVADAPEDFDTLKEMSDWIAGHEDSAAAMNSQIAANTAAVSSLETAKADKSELPTTLPANGGNANTVNGHTVNADVPTDAQFTDTVYTLSAATKTALGGVKIGDNLSVTADGTLSAPSTLPANGGNADTATKLKTARSINGVPFDGTQNIVINSIKTAAAPAAGTSVNLNSENFRKDGYITFSRIDQSAHTIINGITGVEMRGFIIDFDFGGGVFGKQYYTPYSLDALYHRYYSCSTTTDSIVFDVWRKIR